MDDPYPNRPTPRARVVLLLAGLTLALVVLSGVSSDLPDGLEASAAKVGLVGTAPVGGISLADFLPSERLAGLVGVILIGLMLWVLCAKLLVNRRGTGPS